MAEIDTAWVRRQIDYLRDSRAATPYALIGAFDSLLAQRDAAVARAEEAEKQVKRLEMQATPYSMGVGIGAGQLFVHGNYESIKAAQRIVIERDTALARVAELEGENARMRARLSRANQCLGFFVSTIKCGEPWSEVCEREYAATRDSSDAAPLPTPPRKET